MSINISHAAGGQGVVIFNGERILIFYNGVELQLKPQEHHDIMNGTHKGRIYLTTHRVIFVTSRQSDRLLSFSMPFTNMRNVDIKQPIFGANRIEGDITAENNGGWRGKGTFSLTFNHGGAIEFGQSLLESGKRASQNRARGWQPPPYMPPPCAQYYDAPPPAYSMAYGDPSYGFVMQHEAFTAPPPGGVYVNMAPPPYPGVYAQPPPPYYAAPPPGMQAHSEQPPPYAMPQNGANYPPPQGQQSYPPFPQQQPPYPQQQPPYPPPQGAPYPPTGGYPMHNNFQQSGNYNNDLSDAERRKAAEAGYGNNAPVAGFHDPNHNPHMVYASAPPPYNPNYENDNKKAN